MLNEHQIGNLINNKQIISLAKWYLSNPIAINHTSWVDDSYSRQDLKNVKKIIKKAKDNPKLLAFRKPTLKCLFNSLSNGFSLGTNLTKPNEDSVYTIDSYLKHLKKQDIVNWNYIKMVTKNHNQKVHENINKKIITFKHGIIKHNEYGETIYYLNGKILMQTMNLNHFSHCDCFKSDLINMLKHTHRANYAKELPLKDGHAQCINYITNPFELYDYKHYIK